MPMLSVTRGAIILSSTPWGRRGYMYRQWTEGGTELATGKCHSRRMSED